MPCSLPEKVIVTMPYSFTLKFENPTNIFSVKLNAPQNPDSGNGQPLGWDLYAPYYKHYKVLRSRITFTATQMSSSDTGYICVFPVPATKGLTVPLSIREQPRVMTRFMGRTGANCQKRFSYSVKPSWLDMGPKTSANYWGVPNVSMTLGSLPATVHYWTIYWENIADATSNLIISGNVFYTTLFTRNTYIPEDE